MTPPSAEFWASLDKIRTKHDVVIIIDDIFMGGGKIRNLYRLGKYEYTPDISTMGKAIQGIFAPKYGIYLMIELENALPKALLGTRVYILF